MRLTRTIKITAAAAAAVAAVATAASTSAQAATVHHGVTAAQARAQIMGKHTYNPHARLGSVDNPIIVSGGKQNQSLALLTPAQLKSLNTMKAEFEAQARNHKNTATPSNAMKPMGTNCAASWGMYWCDQESASFGSASGTWDEGTLLNSANHETLGAAGSEPGHNYEVYVDQTWNNGANWNGPAGGIANQEWVWTSFFYDGPGYQDRGCLYDTDQSLVACGPWH